MTRRPPVNLAASIVARLKQHAAREGHDYQRVLTRYGIERLLARLCRVEGGDGYALKGAMLFATWDGFAARPTKDVDLLAHGDPSPAAIRAMFERVCAIALVEDLATLVRAVDGTLQRRATTITPGPLLGLSAAFAAVVARAGLWSGFVRRQPPPVPPPPFDEI